jgi:hypothetical protein
LPGVFWLTYFGPHYCHFFGRERLKELEQASAGPDKGITLQLAESPGEVPAGLREMLERRLGRDSFAGTTGTDGPKEDGEYALF